MPNFLRSVSGLIAALPVAAAIAIAGGMSGAQAQTIQTVYSDTSTYTNSGFENGGATDSALTTNTVYDDIKLGAGATGAITGLSFSVANFGATNTTASPILSFFANSTSKTGPGTFLGDITFNPIAFTAGVVSVFTYNPGSTLFTVTGGSFWVGETFTSTTATSAGLNLLGEGTYNPPTVGSSSDFFYLSTATGTGSYASSNPGGSLLFFGGSPVANFGFSFTGQSTAPEPSAFVLALSGGLLTVGGIVRRRRAAK